MTKRIKNIPVWQVTNAWREIMARIFEGLETRINVSPEWLVNPVTNRRLKLDLFYPQIGVTVRFEGLQGKQHRQRPSLEEEAQQRTRDKARLEVCQAHGIELVAVDVTDNESARTFRNIDLSLSRARERSENEDITRKIIQARTTAAALARRIKQPGDLRLYAELWEDRQYQPATPVQATPPPISPPSYHVGMKVEHIVFGSGVIGAISPSDNDILLTVDFVSGGRKMLMSSLVADKLFPK